MRAVGWFAAALVAVVAGRWAVAARRAYKRQNQILDDFHRGR